MIYGKKLDLQLFTEGGSAAGGGEAGEGSAADVRIGDTLEDGTVVDENLASSMQGEDADLYPTRKRSANAQGGQQTGANDQQAAGGDEPTPEEWAAAKKRFAKFYGNDVHDAVNDRFKNQKDATKQLEGMQPMLQELMKTTGAESIEELQQLILDRRYEEEAEAAGIPTEQYKRMQQLEQEHETLVKQQQEAQHRQEMMQHIAGIKQQAEELKQLFPGFDLDKEMQNPEFIKMTSPGGISVKQAFFALHGDDLVPQLMAFGVQTGKDQISRTIQANQARPTEGASMRGASGASVRLDDENMSDERYEEIKRRTLRDGPQRL
jgi:hypothetical protein